MRICFTPYDRSVHDIEYSESTVVLQVLDDPAAGASGISYAILMCCAKPTNANRKIA